MVDLLDRIGGDVARTGHRADLPLERILLQRQHVLHHVDGAVTRRLGTDQAAAILQPLAGEDADELIGQALILTEEIADLARADADVAGRNIEIRADVMKKRGHERLTEAHDLVVRLAFRIEIGAPFPTAHGQAGQRVLEGLLERQELEDTERYAGVKADAALVGPDRIVVLDPITAIDPDISFIILPAHAKDDDAVRLRHAFHDLHVVVMRLVGDIRKDAMRHLMDGLMKLGFPGISLFHSGDKAFQIFLRLFGR